MTWATQFIFFNKDYIQNFYLLLLFYQHNYMVRFYFIFFFQIYNLDLSYILITNIFHFYYIICYLIKIIIILVLHRAHLIKTGPDNQ